MDVNGTRFHLLLGRDDWARRCAAASGQSLRDAFLLSDSGGEADFSFDDVRKELTLGNRVFHFDAAAGNRSVDPSGRRGADADAYGNIYWIDATGTEILVNSSGSGNTAHFWSSLDGCCAPTDRLFAPADAAKPAKPLAKPIALAGLAVTTLHYLVAGTTDPRGLLVFDLHRGGEPRQLLWPVPFAPFDIAATDDGGVWILDRGNKRAWRLDRTMGVVPLGGAPALPSSEVFQPMDGSESHHAAPSSITMAMALALPVTDAVAIDVLPGDDILILDSPPPAAFSRIVRMHKDGTFADASTEVAKNLVEESQRDDFRLLGHDFLYIAAKNVLYVAGNDGNQAVAFELDLDNGGLVLKPLAEFFPMRLFGARALIADLGEPMYDAQDRWVPLVSQKRRRYANESQLIVAPLDGKVADCVWHRLMLDACIPAECDVMVESRAGNDPALLDFAGWNLEPRLLRRATGTELAFADDPRKAGVETWELLFQSARGQYLQLRLTLRGTGRSSPHLRALRAWYPRFSYLDEYLPAVYRENDVSASFLDRFLANFEGIFTNVEDRIAAAQCLFDVRCAPAETLEWLANWFDVALDPAWDEAHRRLFIAHAAEFFEWRGTVPGLMMALRLATEECADESIFDIIPAQRVGPRIVEKFRTRGVPGVVFGDTSDVPPNGLPLRLVKDKWDPSLGSEDLHRRWAELIKVDGARYPIATPTDHSAEWSAFSRDTLGFVPRATSADRVLWQQNLQRRYTSLDALNRGWQTSYANWSAVPLFAQLPSRLAPLRDWLHFEGVILPASAAAHRFTVFLPQGTLGLTDRDRRLDLARRVVALEKPAHTTFDVKFYWAFFRVGEARLGEDTVVDLGGRSPELLSQFILDRNYLGSGWLSAGHPGRSSSDCGCPPSILGGTR